MLMLRVLFSGGMIMSHELHHQQMRNRAQQHHAEKHDPAQRDLKEIDGRQTRNRDQAAQDHHPHM
jgi:hypothetical protein